MEASSKYQKTIQEDPTASPKNVYIDIRPKEFSEKITFQITSTEILCSAGRVIPKTEFPKIPMRIGAILPTTPKPQDVTLAIDFGNTRTIALFVEEPEGAISDEQFKAACRPVMLKPTENVKLSDADQRNVDNAIVNSWFLLEEPEFLTIKKRGEIPRILDEKWNIVNRKTGFIFKKVKPFLESVEWKIPFMFSRYSPVVLGDRATSYLSNKFVFGLQQQGAMIQQSSPKRYYWSKDPVPAYWNMIPRKRTQSLLSLPNLAADILRFFKEDGTYFPADENTDTTYSQDPMPPQPLYPRGNTFIWMLVGILERAWIQCNENPYGVSSFKDFRLTDVVITYPAGWTRHEISSYRKACETAVEIFRKTQFPGKNQKITLNMSLNEAVASQLPFLFSEISGFRNMASKWISMAGKKRGVSNTVRIMNFDIGGGTADVSIIEYGNSSSSMITMADISPKLLFKDGFSIAGDDILLQIIQKCVIPGLANGVMAKAGMRTDLLRAQMMAHLKGIFSGSSSPNESIKRANLVKLCLIPLAIRILKNEMSHSTARSFAIYDVLLQPQWEEFVHFVNQNPENISLPEDAGDLEYDPGLITDIVKKIFGEQFIRCGKNAEAFDVDLFFLSGKTSEIPEIQNLAKRYIPLPLNRILSAKNYRTGDWYPFTSVDHTITDAKSVTAVGAALYHMIRTGKIANWIMQDISQSLTNHTFIWGIYDELRLLDNAFRFVGNQVRVRIPDNVLLGRKITSDSVVEPVYLFRKKKAIETDEQIVQVEVVIEKVMETVDGVPEECLRLGSVNMNGKDRTDWFELVIWQISSREVFWQDSGKIFDE